MRARPSRPRSRALSLSAPDVARGSPDASRSLAAHASRALAGEFDKAAPEGGYLDRSTTLESFAVEQRALALAIDATYDYPEREFPRAAFEDDAPLGGGGDRNAARAARARAKGVTLDGGPHTLWWSSQDQGDGRATPTAPVAQLLHAIAPAARLVVTLAEPARRAYSDYYFLTRSGVTREGDVAAHSPDEFDALARAQARRARALSLALSRAERRALSRARIASRAPSARR